MTSSAFAPDCLRGRTALVTGASSGIGAACAQSLANAGARVVVTGRNAERLRKISASLGKDAVEIAADLGAPDAADVLAAKVLAAVGTPDILVNSAGFGDIMSSTRLTSDVVDRVLAVNVRAPLLLSGKLLRPMAQAKRGSIVNVSSVVASLGTSFQAAYAASKGALEAMTRSLAQEFGGHGVRVNAVAPGLIATEMWGERLNDEKLIAAAQDYTALKYWGTADMVADVVTFLASDASRYITGEVIYVDGGLVNTGHLVPPSFF